jgi:dihydrofolate reductase
MNVFIIAALSADGFIAKDEHHMSTEWTSKADKKRFVQLTKEAGVMVMGSSTYKTIGRPLPGRTTIVYTRSGAPIEGVETTQLAPHELIKELADRGFKSVAICGGSQIYTLFMKAKAVNTLHLTIEPVVFGTGVKLFNDDVHSQLTLKNKDYEPESGTILLEYKVNYGGPAV